MLALPLLGLLSTSLIPAFGVPLNAGTATLANYAYVLFEHAALAARLRQQLPASASAAILIVLIAVPLAYFIVVAADRGPAAPAQSRGRTALRAARRRARHRRDPALPQAAAVLGVSLYNTVWIILFAYLARFLVLGLRPIISGYRQIDRTLEEAAQVAGAGLPRRLATIILPAGRAGRRGGRAPGLPHRLQRAHRLGPALVLGRRDARRRRLLLRAGRRFHLCLGAGGRDRPRHGRADGSPPSSPRHCPRECCRGATDLDRAQKRFGSYLARGRRLDRGRGRRVPRRARPLRLRQDDAAAPDRRLRASSTAGTIRIGDRLVSSAQSPYPAGTPPLGIVFQSYALWPHMRWPRTSATR